MVTQLAVYNDRLIVGDSMHSVSLISVSADGVMKTIARDFIPLWPMAVEAVDESSIIGANDGLNLFSFSLETHEGGRNSLKRDGFYHFGDVVSKIIRGVCLSYMYEVSNAESAEDHLGHWMFLQICLL